MKQSQATASVTVGSMAARPTVAPLQPQGALFDLQRSGGNQAFIRLLSPLRVQTKADNDDIERQVAQTEAPRQPAPEAAAEPAAAKEAPAAEAGAREAPAFVVDDERRPNAGQLTRSLFLARVREAVRRSANEGFAGTGRTADDCPWIEHWLGRYESRDAAYLNRSLIKLAPETAQASGADDAIAMIAARVRRSVDAYVETGELTGVPDGISPEIPGMSAVGSFFGSLLRKALPGRGMPGRGRDPSMLDPQAVQARLGAGQPLPSSVRSRMGAAFGVSFSGVRMHDDAQAAGLSADLDARAFAVGEHIAFSAGEYRPGTLVGDALIAHELAHTIQQGGGAAGGPGSVGESAQLEAEADRSAVAVVRSLWEGPGEAAAKEATPPSRSGLRLSRCSPKAQAPGPKVPKPGPATPAEKPPRPEDSYWFEDPKKQAKETEGGDRTLDFGKKGEGKGAEITSVDQTRHQVVVDKPADYSHLQNPSVSVRFAYSALGFGSGQESTQTKNAKTAVLAALKDVLFDISSVGTSDLSWENAAEKRKLLAQRKTEEENQARMKELFKNYDDAHPLNIYLAPETQQEVLSGQYIPTTAQVWVRMADVGDPAKLKTALRIPLHHALGGANPAAAGGVDQAGDLKRTMIHESVHALLLNRSADSMAVWNEVQASVKITGPEPLRKKAMDLVHAYLLAEEELFAYSTEETLYAPVTQGPQASGKPLYELFVNQARLFFKKKGGGPMGSRTKKIDVSERRGATKKDRGKKVAWQIDYDFPTSLTLTEADEATLDFVLQQWPLK